MGLRKNRDTNESEMLAIRAFILKNYDFSAHLVCKATTRCASSERIFEGYNPDGLSQMRGASLCR